MLPEGARTAEPEQRGRIRLQTRLSQIQRCPAASPSFRQDNPKLLIQLTKIPASFVHLMAFSHCSFVTLFFSTSRILWQPDSTPNMTSSQCALLILATTPPVTASARVPQPHRATSFFSLPRHRRFGGRGFLLRRGQRVILESHLLRRRTHPLATPSRLRLCLGFWL